MNLIKYTEAYILSDTTDNKWVTSGQVTKDDTNTLRIDFAVSLDDKHIGDYSYSMDSEKNIHSGFNCSKEFEEEFSNYGDNLIKDILDYLEVK